MASASIREVRKRLSDYVASAERGQTVTITRRGREVARLVPPVSKRRRRWPDLTAFRASVSMTGAPMSETVIAMRREARY